MSPLKYLMGHTSPTHRSPISPVVDSENDDRTVELFCLSAAPGLQFSHVQMWMCDEINVAQVKRAGRDAAHPHSSLLAHIQILKFMLHKQFACQHIILPFVFIYSSLPRNF